MPLLIRGCNTEDARHQAEKLLGQTALSHRLEHKPSELSGGERQRVAIARALVGEPRCVLMDEPTGNLDRRTAESIHELMRELNERLQISFVVVTHDDHLASMLDRQYQLISGRLTEKSEHDVMAERG